MRKLVALSVIVTLSLAVALYWIKYDTRRLQAKVQAQERAIERAEGDIVVLRTEGSFLSRPERLAAEAKGRLGLGPARSDQLVGIDELRRRLGPRRPVGAAGEGVPAGAGGRAP
jgi:cell division protein FtsL